MIDTIDKLKKAFIERILFNWDECLVDSLMRIDEKYVSLCKYCYYCNWSIGKNTICKHTLDRKLRELL